MKKLYIPLAALIFGGYLMAAEIKDYDSTAANNNAAAPNGAPEGMAPSGVNDTMREMMARMKRAIFATVNVTSDTSAGDDAAMGYTATEGLILTGQGSTNDVTIKNDADATVISIPTGTTNVAFAGDVTHTGTSTFTGGITSGGNIVSDTDSTDDLGTTSVRWANVYTDSIGDTGQDLTVAATTVNLPSGHVFDYNAGDITVTHASNKLAIEGGNLLIGTATPATGGPKLDVLSTGVAIVGTSTVTDSATKTFRVGGRHFTNSEEPVGVLVSNSASGASTLSLGAGGSGSLNAPTLFNLYLAANTITTGGTNVLQINTSAITSPLDMKLGDQTSVGDTPGAALHVDDSGAVVVKFEKSGVDAQDFGDGFVQKTAAGADPTGGMVAGAINAPDIRKNNIAVPAMATGNYTGDGTTSQAITGLGFQPKYIRIWNSAADGASVVKIETSDNYVDDDPQGLAVVDSGTGGTVANDNRVLSLDADGFTVSDDSADEHPNKSGTVYQYVAWG